MMRPFLKTATILSFGLLWLSLFCSSDIVMAQDAKATKVLEYSLMSLKESAHEVEQANAGLRRENQQLQHKIEAIKKEIEMLDKKVMHADPRTSTESLLAEDKKDYNQVKASRINQQLKQLASEEERLKAQLNGKLAQWKELEAAVKKVEKDIEALKDQVKTAEQAAKGNDSYQQWVILKDSQEKGEAALLETEKELAAIKRQHSGPLKELEKLQRRNLILKKRQKRLDVELEHSDREEAKLLQELEEIKANYFGKTINLEEKVSYLQQKAKELKAVLLEAKLKIDEKGIELDVPEEATDIDQLRENLTVIKKENQQLYNEFSILREKLKK